MSAADQERWDRRYAEAGGVDPAVPAGFADVVDLIPDTGRAIDVACGAGAGSVWLAQRGLDVIGVDGSDVAIGLASALAVAHDVGDRCQFIQQDLDGGLPPGGPVHLISCHLFSAPGLDAQMIERLLPGGVLAITVLSEVGGEPGPFRAGQGELLTRFAGLEVRAHREAGGTATLVAAAAGPMSSTRLD